MNFENILFSSKLQQDEELLPFVAVADDETPVREDHFSDILPVMPLKNTVLFPGVIIPITVGRDKSIRAVTKSQDGEKYILVLTQKDPKTEEPRVHDLYQTGTVARIVKLLKMPDGSHTVILQGRKRCLVAEWLHEEPYLEARVSKREHIISKKHKDYDVLIKVIPHKFPMKLSCY
jgi:ATP-dependent Lon protease